LTPLSTGLLLPLLLLPLLLPLLVSPELAPPLLLPLLPPPVAMPLLDPLLPDEVVGVPPFPAPAPTSPLPSLQAAKARQHERSDVVAGLIFSPSV
jgi:hypothetical protein